jgi:rhamnosyltransferase subunit B
MNFVVSGFGSAGDFLPSLAIGGALQRRGHRVVLVANPFYESRARHAGLELVPAGAFLDLYAQLEQNPRYADPLHATMLLRDFVAPDTIATYPVVGALLRERAVDAVVASDVAFGALWAAAERSVPSALVQASPALWMGWDAPLVFADSRVAARLARPMSALAPSLLAFALTRFLRPLARCIGMRRGSASYRAALDGAALRLGLWSPQLRGRVPSDPPRGLICGFARASALGGEQAGLAPEVESFLAAGPPPVVVGFGSAYALGAGPILAAIAEACAALEQRCLVVGHPAGASFPPNTLAVRYAPYDRVFPRAAAVVVHGGAGTSGEALRSGKPILGVPFAFDQFTLCAAIERLGAGRRQPLRARRTCDFISSLRALLADGGIRGRAREVGARFSAERDGAETAADAVERLGDQRARRAAG